MSKRIHLALVTLLAVASVATATYFAAQRAASERAKTQAQPSPGRQRTPSAQGRATAAPLRPADPNRAPQSAVDEALYTDQEFFGVNASVMRPYQTALERILALEARYPKDARLRLHSARLAERLGQFEKAASEMREYVELKRRSPDALRRLAAFYHDRALHADQVRALLELARALPAGQRAPVYKRAAEVVRSRSLAEFKPADFFAELVSADPSNVQPVKDYVEELTLGKQYREAQSALASFQPKFPEELPYFLKTRAAILETTGDRRAAEEVYSSAFDPLWPREVASDYYDLLRRFGRYRVVRRGLQDQVRGGTTDLQIVARLFSIFAYEGNNEYASRLLTELEARRSSSAGSRQPWTARELEMVAGMFASIGHYDQSSRYLYTLYLAGGLQAGSQQREEALHRLFRVMLDAAGAPTRVAAGDLSFYRDVAEVDQHPGFMNGVLSLILSGTNPAQEFANQEQAAAGYFNRAFAHRIFTAFKQEYAQSSRLGGMYLGVINVFSSLGEHRLAVEAGREFQQRYPDSPNYAQVSLRMADSFVALKDRASERATLGALLDRLARARQRGAPLVPSSSKRWSYGISPRFDQLIDRIRYNIEAYSDTYDPTMGGGDSSPDEGDDSDEGDSSYDGPEVATGPTYSSVLERYVSSLASEEKKTETVAFFWNEIKKHPREEGLYERFLSWLGQAELINEQLKAYNSAIRQFDSNTWYHRLARWYVRQKRGRELSQYSRQLINIFDEEEITEYLLRFAGYGTASAADGLNWDQRLAFDLYSYAHDRFPRNTFFVRGMLTHLEKTDRTRWERLSTEYYFADRSIREPYLAWLSRQGQLRDRYQRSRQQSSADNQPAALAPYSIFAADAALWLSHHDEALDAYRRLVSLYPGEAQYAERLADLTRSYGHESDRLYEESASVLSAMADIYPSDHSYRIKSGEAYAELGDFKRAGEQWDRLIRTEPGERNTYLEVATVYWDYYQFDQSLRVFKQLRDVTGDQTIYAYRMGAVYEGKGDMDSAIAEYVKVLSEPGEGRDTVAKRLAQLSRRAGLADKIAAAYNNARSANPGDWQLVIGYAVYQSERERSGDALAILRGEVERSSDVAFLETTRDLFREILRPEDERLVLARLASVARDEREAMMYRLQQASFLERNNQMDGAIQIIDKLVAEYPTNLGVVEESARFYWRAGLLDRSMDLYKRTLAQARGANRRGLILQLARRQSDAGKLADAEATLRAYYDENRLDSEVFGELARTLGAENKLAELAELYSAAFKDVRESGLGGDESRSRIVELRAGMIRTLDSLGRYQDAVDQHIEIINTLPEEADRIAAAIDYAERHDLVERLTAYYEKLSKESFKNYRWQLVLGRIYERRGNLAGASEQYRTAVLNEPQRPDLRFSLASTLARQRRYDEAITVLREGWALAGRDPQWLIEAARIQVQQGKRDDAAQTVRQALAAKKNARAADLFKVASQLAEWGLDAEAVRIYEQTFAALPKTLKDEYVPYDAIGRYVRALVRVEAVAPVFQKVERLRSQYLAIAQNSQDTDGYRARSIVSQMDEAMRSDFGRGVIDYAGAQEAGALASAVQAASAKLTLYSDREELARYLGIARGAGLVDAEEAIYIKIKDAAFKARTKPEDLSPYNELRALVAFYNRRAAFVRAAETLASEYARDPHKGQFDYQHQMAVQYRLAGDTARELEWLRAAYTSASGNLSPSQIDWVDRYLSLLYSSSQRDELQRLASSYSPHQLQLINFFLEKGEKALARTAIANARQSGAWAASRSGEVGLFLKDTSVETEAFFKAALDVRPIGEMLERQPDSARVLVGDDWFVAARNYGFWLGLTPTREPESRNFVVAEAERHPSSAAAHLQLAAYYLDRKDAARASDALAMAAELAPGAKEVTLTRGSIALARGDRRGALDAWNTLISGRVTVSEAEAYLKVMADNGLLREALPQLENYIVAFVNRSTRNDREERLEAIKPLVREMAGRASSDSRLTGDVAAALNNIISRVPGDTAIARMIIDESLLPETQLAGLYRVTHQRLSDMAASVFGTSEYENGYYNGSEYIYPAQALADFRRRLLDYLIRQRAFDEARLLVATIRQEMADLDLALEEDDTRTSESRYIWLPLASALVELRAGSDPAKAVAELRRYCGLDAGPTDTHRIEDRGAVDERCLKAYALLVAEGRASEADAMLYDAYRAAARTSFSNDASLAGLAEIEARRGRADEAARLLKMMTERSTDNQNALRLAAEVAARINRYGDAIAFREQMAQANPTDSTNRLELARALAASGRAGESIDRIAALISERVTPNSVRAQAAEVVGMIVRADRSLAGRVASLLDQRVAAGDAGAALIKASALEATGTIEEARSLLQSIRGGSLAAVAQMKLGLIARDAGRDQEAIAGFERAIYLDADGAITAHIAFRSSGPRAQLILLYGRAGRDLAAVRLAEGETATQQSAISAVIMRALSSGNEGVAVPQPVSFEPSLETARARQDGLRTIAELNDATGPIAMRELLASLAQSAARLGQYDRAIAMERVLVAEATRPEEKAAFEKALAEMIAAQRARQASAASLIRIDTSNASQSIYALKSQI